jgi:2-polyprenyl-6-methoxyphenol hydroxylase-like FAD-dependent oxidoreductase
MTKLTTALKTEVLIIGAGPTGLAMATQLERFGIDALICDGKSGPTTLSKALVVHARTLEIYDQLHLAQAAITEGQRVDHWVMMHQGQVAARLNFENIGAGQSPFPFILIFEQSKNEQLLYQHLQSKGREVLWEHSCVSVEPFDTGVAVDLQTPTGALQRVTAKYVVGCDGASSPVRHALHLPFTGSTLSRLFYVADVRMEMPVEAASLYVSFNDQQFVLLAPMQGQNHWRIIGNLPSQGSDAKGSEGDGSEKTDWCFEDVISDIKQVVQRPMNIHHCEWFSTYRVHTRHGETFYKDRCFLAGDAAHVHTPAGGQGMNTGIQDAYNLAWKLWFHLRQGATAVLFDTYNQERLKNAQQLLKSTDQAFQMMVGEHRVLRFLRDHILPGVAHVVTQFPMAQELIFPFLSQTGIHYPESDLSQSGRLSLSVKPGDRLPYFEIEGQSIYLQLQSPCFYVLVFEDGVQDTAPLKAVVNELGEALLQQVCCPLYPFLAKRFGVHNSFYLLLRPDLHIARIAMAQDTDALSDFFKTWRTSC